MERNNETIMERSRRNIYLVFCCCFNRFGEISLNNAKIIPKIRITLPTLNVLLGLSRKVCKLF